MYLTSDVKKKIFKEHGGKETNTGSSEGQIALFSTRVNHLTKQLQANPKDVATKRALVNLVSKRKRLLDYLKRVDITRYRAIVKKLDLRR